MNYDPDDDEIDIFLDSRDFAKKVLNYQGVTVVEFYATWCPPCCQFQLIKKEYLPLRKNRNYYNWYKIDIEKNLEFAKGFELEGVPSVFLFYKGQIIDRFVGLDLKGFDRIKQSALQLVSQQINSNNSFE
ncbi:hypothetical protein ABPG74_002588 [Tetrahymena malaccensis]